MEAKYLHYHENFNDLIQIIAHEKSIEPILVEKDYWIMQCLYGLQKQGFSFFLKGGTSLSKGYQLIHRFSEDIDILIKPHKNIQVSTGKNQNSPKQIESRKIFFESLAKEISIDGISKIYRNPQFDDLKKFRNAGIVLHYPTQIETLPGVKNGILLEVGFDQIDPFERITISSWMYDFAFEKVKIIDNRAISIPCYHPGYTFVEKMQAISTKFRKEQEEGYFSPNFIRHYYDLYQLLEHPIVTEFIGSNDYYSHKEKRFGTKDIKNISKNPAFILDDPNTFKQYEKQYENSSDLYYKENSKPPFKDIIFRLRTWADKL